VQKLLACAVFATTFLWVSSSSAKVGDPPPVVDGDVVFKSHDNYVEAFDNTSSKLLWKSIVYKAGNKSKIPDLEEDVQWNIIKTIRLQGELIYIRNGKGQEFLLDKRTGKVK
jgi:hypothetical protein